MKKIVLTLGMCLFIAVGGLYGIRFVYAGMEWTVLKEIKLGFEPLDVAISYDGQSMFVLVPEQILIYSISKGMVTNRIKIDKGFDRLAYSTKTNTLIVSSNAGKRLRIIQIEEIHDISISGLPYKGPADAPVTIAVFSDYQ